MLFALKTSLPALQGITALQLCYFSLSCYPEMDPILKTLLILKPITGYNKQSF